MKAFVVREHGEIENTAVMDVPEPTPAPGEAVVQVHAAALNHLDIWVRKGRPGFEMPMPHVLGSDAAGVVVAVGAGVDESLVGKAVIISPGLPCGRCERCHEGQHSECVQFGIIGLSRPGVFAEKAAVPAANLLIKPDELSFPHAAALPVAYLTAWRMLFTRARLMPGETVLIHGIGGGVALAALQLATLAGARAVCTSSSDDKLHLAKQLGSNSGVNYRTSDDVAAAVLDATDGRGVDVVIDSVGAATWETNFQATRKGGRIVHCGVTTGAAVQANLQLLYWKQLTVMGSTYGGKAELEQLLRTVVASGLEPVVDSTEPLDRARAAMERMEQGKQFGKIILNVSM